MVKVLFVNSYSEGDTTGIPYLLSRARKAEDSLAALANKAAATASWRQDWALTYFSLCSWWLTRHWSTMARKTNMPIPADEASLLTASSVGRVWAETVRSRRPCALATQHSAGAGRLCSHLVSRASCIENRQSAPQKATPLCLAMASRWLRLPAAAHAWVSLVGQATRPRAESPADTQAHLPAVAVDDGPIPLD